MRYPVELRRKTEENSDWVGIARLCWPRESVLIRQLKFEGQNRSVFIDSGNITLVNEKVMKGQERKSEIMRLRMIDSRVMCSLGFLNILQEFEREAVKAVKAHVLATASCRRIDN